MTEPPRYPGAPRWVKVSGIVVGGVLLLALILLLIPGGHGPGRHLPPSDRGMNPSNVEGAP